jgi:hypothetical protein
MLSDRDFCRKDHIMRQPLHWSPGILTVLCLLSAVHRGLANRSCAGAESVADIVVFSVQGGMVFFQSCDDAVAYCGDVTVGVRVQRACPEACSTPCATPIVDPICTGLWSGFVIWFLWDVAVKPLFYTAASFSVSFSPANFSGVTSLPSYTSLSTLADRRCVQVSFWLHFFLFFFRQTF